MKLLKPKYADAVMRGGFCMVWMTGLVLGICNAVAALAESDPTVAVGMANRTWICLAIFLVAALAHAHLIGKKITDGEDAD